MRASSFGAFAAAARVVPVASRRSSPVALSSCGEAPAAARRAALARAPARVPRGRVAASTRATAEDDASAAAPMDSEPPLLRHAGLEGDALVASVDATKATEIKAELKVFGVNTAGLKAQIAERLVECYRITNEGGDPKEVLKKRTLARLKDAEDARDAVAARRDARRKRKGGYAIAPDAAAARRKNQRPIRAAGVSRPRTSGGAKAKVILDVDPAEDEEDEEEKYKVTAPGAEGRRKLNVQRRDLDRQSNFQETMRDEGWYMVAVPEEREERAVRQILSLSGTDKADGATIDAWIPRVPPPGYVASASEASGRTAVQLMQAVPEEGATKPFPGFVLLRMSLNPTLLASLDDLYAFKGFAVGGITRYGSTRRQTGEAPRTVPKAQMDSMSAMCAVRVVPDDEAERVRAEEKKRAEAAKLAEAMGEMEVASEEDIAAARQSATKTGARRNEGEDAPEPEENTTPVATPPEGARTVEVHEGPFKGFRGYATNENDDGTVDAKLTIFGRETAVTLEPGEFEFSS